MVPIPTAAPLGQTRWMSTADSPEATIRALGVRGEGAATPRERLLGQAFVLFYAEGIRAVGIDLIIARADVAKATFYRHFPSKLLLVVAYLDRRQDAWMTWLQGAVAARAQAPAEQLLAIFDALAELFADRAFNGCPLVNAVAELGTVSPEVMDRATFHRAELHRYVAGLARATGVRSPSELAERWVLLIDGAYVGAQRTMDADVAHRARAAAEVLLADG